MQGHNRWWADSTSYAKQNGGDWDFLIDRKSGTALPYSQGFWDYLLSSSKREWGLSIYEQDWYVLFNTGLPMGPRPHTPPYDDVAGLMISLTGSRRSPKTPPSDVTGSCKWGARHLVRG